MKSLDQVEFQTQDPSVNEWVLRQALNLTLWRHADNALRPEFGSTCTAKVGLEEIGDYLDRWKARAEKFLQEVITLPLWDGGVVTGISALAQDTEITLAVRIRAIEQAEGNGELAGYFWVVRPSRRFFRLYYPCPQEWDEVVESHRRALQLQDTQAMLEDYDKAKILKKQLLLDRYGHMPDEECS